MNGYPTYNPPKDDPLPKPGYQWNTALAKFKKHPEKYPKWIYFEDEHVRVIYDPYPKANVHLLVLPLNDLLPFQVSEFTLINLPELKKVHNIARGIAKSIDERHSVELWNCKIGYHARPAMIDLHLHIITQDFDSESLKNKKHWNSFNTEWFVPIDKVESDLLEHGLVLIPDLTDCLKRPLKCHRCGEEFRFLPRLKEHLSEPCI